MNVQIIATKDCNHRPILERRLQELGVEFSVRFVEDHEDLEERYQIRKSPNLVIDDEVVFRAKHDQPLPDEKELKRMVSQ